ncbi:MAG: hypothetical protein JWQ43_415 [Glaciihabitans sp.]|nr:hypothetical protein [Glaciihabitans sp.]
MSAETGPSGPEVERVVASLRPHGRALFWPSLALVIISGVTAYFVGSFDAAWQNWTIFGLGAALVVLVWLLPMFAWLGRRYVITTRRIVLRRGLFVRSRQELLHSRGYDVTVRKNALQSMFRSGNIQINTGLDHPVVLTDVPNADLVQAVLHDLMEANQNFVSTRRQQSASRPGSNGTGGIGGTGDNGPRHGSGGGALGSGYPGGNSGGYGTGPTTAYGQGNGQGYGRDNGDTGETTAFGSR